MNLRSSILVLSLQSLFVAPLGASVPEHFFRDHYLSTYAITDVRVSLAGLWSDTQVKRLADLLKELHADRPTRAARIHEWPYVTRLEFENSDHFEHQVDEDHAPNPAAIWGSGLSGFITHRFELPMYESDEELKARIKPHLPEILVRNPEVREKWQAEVAETLRGSHGLCARLFGSWIGR